MPQSLEDEISAKDIQWISTYHLGHPLRVYRLSRSYIRFEGVSGLIITFIALPLSIALILTEKSADLSASLPSYLSGIFLFIVGLVGLTMISNARKLRLIVCEFGLLEVTGIFGYHCGRIIYWDNVRRLQRGFFNEYRVIAERGKSIVVSAFIYQDGDELLAFIQEKIAERQQ